MRILFLSNIPTPYQIDFFDEVGKSVEILAVFLWRREENRDWVLSDKSWIKILSDTNKKPTWKVLKKILIDFKPDHVMVGGYKLPLSTKVKIYCYLNKINFHYWLEKPLNSKGIKKIARILIWLVTLPLCNRIFCIGESAINSYRFLSKKLQNLPYSIDCNRYTYRNVSRTTTPVKFLFVGQYIDRKGVPEILDIFSSISKNEATLTMVGSGKLNFLVEESASKYENIKNLGFINPDNLPILISKHDVLLAPSRHDGWAVIVIEAMLTGLPVISTKETGAFFELGVFGGPDKNGTLCEVNTKSIRKGIMGYIENPERVNVEGTNARRTVLQSLAISKNAAQKLINCLS